MKEAGLPGKRSLIKNFILRNQLFMEQDKKYTCHLEHEEKEGTITDCQQTQFKIPPKISEHLHKKSLKYQKKLSNSLLESEEDTLILNMEVKNDLFQ